MQKKIKVYTDEQFTNCWLSKVNVEVSISREYNGEGKIQSFNDNIIKINNEYYMRSKNTFYTYDNYFRLL